MITEARARPAAALFLFLLAVPIPPADAATESFAFAYVTREDDPYHAPHKSYTGLKLRDRRPAVDGAKVAIRDGRIPGRAIGVKFRLQEEVIGKDQNIAEALGKLADTDGIRAFVLDVPLQDLRETSRSLADRDVFLFNVRHRDDVLRGEECSRVLFHTIPSNAMLMDALAQYLVKKNWPEVLMLQGEADGDAVVGAAFHASAKKFRLDVVDTRKFVLSNDPRVRDQSNIALLTGSTDYDVVFLADSVGEVGRYVPFQTRRPRPVIGSEGLMASAWHWTWERHGAPQLNQRFDRIGKRRMHEEDWAAWAAVTTLVQAMVRTRSRDAGELRSFLHSGEFTLDTYKSAPGSYRPWSNQLRQTILLHTHNAVIAAAPFEGFLHEKNNLDTLGADRRESKCGLR